MMRSLRVWLLSLALLNVLSTPARAAAPTLTLTWLDTQQLALTWNWPADTQQACLFLHRELGQTIFVGCVAPPAEAQLTLPPGDPPWDAAYRPLVGDRIEVRFYQTDLIVSSIDAVLETGPPRLWLPLVH